MDWLIRLLSVQPPQIEAIWFPARERLLRRGFQATADHRGTSLRPGVPTRVSAPHQPRKRVLLHRRNVGLRVLVSTRAPFSRLRHHRSPLRKVPTSLRFTVLHRRSGKDRTLSPVCVLWARTERRSTEKRASGRPWWPRQPLLQATAARRSAAGQRCKSLRGLRNASRKGR